jgi:hypothetical protein
MIQFSQEVQPPWKILIGRNSLKNIHFHMGFGLFKECLVMGIVIIVIKSLGYFCLGLIDIVFRLINREWQKAIFNSLMVYSWFVACGYIYPYVQDKKYPFIHMITLYIYFAIQGHKLLFTKEGTIKK